MTLNRRSDDHASPNVDQPIGSVDTEAASLE
jgi:hypothetical protein